MKSRTTNLTAWRMLAIVSALAVSSAACGGQQSQAQTAPNVGTVTKTGISPERCEANRQAGKLTYLTSFDYAASASIIDVVVADAKGYFAKMCLDVELQPGFTTDNVPLVSAGRAVFSSLGSSSEVAAAVGKGADLRAIAVYGHTAVEALAASKKSGITAITDVRGTTMGVLGSIPYSVRVMLVRSGVPLDSFEQAQVGFDPSLLDKGDFQSRPVYKSSEPRQLDAAGIGYKLFDPAQSRVPASFGVMVVNEAFSRQHPTAVEDFLRADLAGFSYAMDHPDEAVDLTFAKSDPKYYLTKVGEQYRWSIESRLVRESTPPNTPYGYLSADAWSAEVRTLVDDLRVIPAMPDTPSYDDRFFRNVHEGSTVVFPG